MPWLNIIEDKITPMKIEKIRIENFRCFKDETIKFDDYTSIVGPNGIGKSTIFHALNLFFRESKDSKTDLINLSSDDFHHNNTESDIKITVTFTHLPEKAKEDLKDYVRHDKLIITAVASFDQTKEKAEVKQFGNRLAYEGFRVFFDAEKRGTKVNDLKVIYKGLTEEHPELRKESTKANMTTALQDYESERPEICTLIPSEDQFYGVSKGANRLQPYIQWIFIPAVKDVTEEGEENNKSALGKLLARTVRTKVNFQENVQGLREEVRKQYQKILDAEQKTLDDISNSLQKRLRNFAHPNVSASIKWKQDPEKSVRIEEPYAGLNLGERGFEGELSRFGNGIQRSYILALLQELIEYDNDNIPTLIMGIEEPELYQHPPQVRHLAETLLELSNSNSQVIICTHSPFFIPGDNFDKIRVACENGDPSETKIKQISYTELAATLHEVGEKLLQKEGMVAKLYPTLNPIINEMFFCRKLILTEGYEDVAYINSYLLLQGKMTDFRREGCHIVPVEGKNKLVKPLAIAKLLKIPTFVLFDLDTDKDQIENPARRNSEVAKHKKDNKSILSLKGYSEENEWPNRSILKEDLIGWKTNLTTEISTELGEEFKQYEDIAASYYGNSGGLKKNPLAIAKALEEAWNNGLKSDKLIECIGRILAFIEK